LPQLTSGQSSDPLDWEPDPGDVAALVYTSGTTGRPKGAMLTQANFAANALNLVDAWKMSAADRLLLALPLFHVHGLGNGLHTWLACGYRLRLLTRFLKESIVDEFLDFRPTVFFGVPTMYERLLETPPEQAREIGGFVRLFVSGSAPLPAATLEKFRDLFGHDILERYGMSETLMNTSNPYDGERRAGSVGLPLPNVSIKIRNPETDADVADGETGEVQIKGPNVFAGYWRQAQATEDAFSADGYFRSGDLGMRAADGYITLQGRGKELIIAGGFNIYPREVEEFLTKLPGVREAAVVGVPDPLKGEVPIGYVAVDSGCDLNALAAQCRGGLASFKIPKRFVRVETLPRNALGKVQKHLLAEPG
jgi:malonyl-CoA/methylmalonyl-CoA synthetase